MRISGYHGELPTRNEALKPTVLRFRLTKSIHISCVGEMVKVDVMQTLKWLDATL